MPTYFTEKGFENYRIGVSNLESKLKNLLSQTQEAAELGGDAWHDNASYEHLMEDIHMSESRLKMAKELLKNVKIIRYPDCVDKVVLGCEIKLLMDGIEKQYEIIAYGESDGDNKKVLYDAPISRVLMGHSLGDKICSVLGDKKREIEILDLKPLSK
jgi:transcription elongation GreA/GreB family factor